MLKEMNMKRDYTAEISAIKSEVIREIKDILIAHDGKAANFSMNCCDCPVVINVPYNDDETYILDIVGLKTNPRTNRECVELEYSNSYVNAWDYADNLDVEFLIQILEIMEEEGDDLFEDEDEDEDNRDEMPWDYGKHFE